MNGGGYGWERARARPQRRNSLALKTILWWQPRNGDHSHENNSTGLGKGVISGKNQTIDGATNTSASNHAPKISATLYEKPLEHQEVAIVGKRWRLNQPLQNSCGAIRNTHSASITNNHSGLSLFTKFWEEKIEKIVWSVNSHNIAKIVDFPRKETTYLIYFGCFVGLSNGTVKFCFVRDHSYYYVSTFSGLATVILTLQILCLLWFFVVV